MPAANLPVAAGMRGLPVGETRRWRPDREPTRVGFSLTKRLILLTAILFIPGVILLLHHEQDLRRARNAEVRELALHTARQLGAELERVLEGTESSLRTLAHALSVLGPDRADCSGLIWSLQARLPHFSSLFILDREGRVICPDYAPRDEQRYDTRAVFRELREGKPFTVDAAGMLGRSDKPALPMGVALLQRNEMRGAVVAALDLEWLSERLRARGFLKRAELTVADRDGQILFQEPSTGPPLRRVPELSERLAQGSGSGIFEARGTDGRPRVIGYVSASPPHGLFVSASLPRDAVFASLSRATRRTLALMGLGLIAAATVAWLLGRLFIQRPIDRLVATLAAWREGEASARTGMKPGRGEIEALGVAIDGLLREVEARQEETAEAVKALQESEERYRRLIELSPDAQFVTYKGQIVYVNAAMVRLLGAADGADLRGRPPIDLIDSDHEADEPKEVEVRGAPRSVMAEQRWRRLDGGFVDVEVVSARVPWNGAFAHQVTLRDIRARKLANERQRFLLHELDHRVKNTLATVQSLAMQGLRGASSVKEFAGKFIPRLIALSATQNLLTENRWQSVSLRDLLANELRPYGDERVRFEGEDLQLPPRIIVPLGMIVHELATNAAKYGALSTSAGRILLSWQTDDDRLRIEWREEGGPATEDPTTTGFGSRLLDRTVRGELAGEYERVFRPSGLVCRLMVPLSSGSDAEQRDAA
jgi:PAS domain S-box-containing protein